MSSIINNYYSHFNSFPHRLFYWFNSLLFFTLPILRLKEKWCCGFSRPLAVQTWPSNAETKLLTTMNMGTEEQLEPRWCSKQQIYLNGRVPRAESALDVSSLLNLCDDSNKCLRIFGYGSLCWNPGTGVLSNPEVTRTLGRAVGWRRCWAQRSADHRGTPFFPGIVCTLLQDKEVQLLRGEFERGSGSTATQHNSIESTQTSMTEGLIYTIPVSLVDECLAELVGICVLVHNFVTTSRHTTKSSDH